MLFFFFFFFSEEKPPRCFDHRGPAASLTGDGNGAKRPQQKGAPKPAWAEPQEDHPPHSTLTLDIKGWRSPVGYRGLDFPARGSRQAGRRLLLARVCSGKVVRGYRGRAGLVASLHGKRSACRAKRGKFSFAPPRMLESPSPLLDGVSLGFSCFPLPSCKLRQLALGFSLQNLPPSSLQPGIWGDQGAAPWKGAPTMALRVAGLLLAVGAGQATAVVRLQGATLIFLPCCLRGKKTPAFVPILFIFLFEKG